jgi:hypothetical protein
VFYNLADAFSPSGSYRYGKPYLRCWTKDYFTSALPSQQRGTAPAFPVNLTGLSGNTVFNTGNPPYLSSSNTNPTPLVGSLNIFPTSIPPSGNQYSIPYAVYGGTPAQSIATTFTNMLNNNTINMTGSSAVTFNVADLRRIVQLQRWQERNMRGGVRYTEFLKAHFNVAPSDDRLQRPEYIGGVKGSIVVSEVLQTSVNVGSGVGNTLTTPQGNMSGHGVTNLRGFAGKYFVKEYGYILGIMSIMPTPSYEDGIDRQWMRKIKTDFYFPEFVNLSEQAILTGEIFSYANAEDVTPWGYQPQYDEMRIKRNMVCTDFRVNSSSPLAFWHLGRHFTNAPSLGMNFVLCNPPQFRRVFAVPSVPPFICSVANLIKAVRPLPYIGEPGLVDHH